MCEQGNIWNSIHFSFLRLKLLTARLVFRFISMPGYELHSQIHPALDIIQKGVSQHSLA
jgi:hypothetical protein